MKNDLRLKSGFGLPLCLVNTLMFTLLFVQPLSAKTTQLPKAGLVASYTFENDKDGVVVDGSGTSHGKATNVEYKEGVIGMAAEFNGIDSKILIDNVKGYAPKSIADLKIGTVSFWIKFKNRGGQVLPILYLGKKDSSMPTRSMIFEIGHDRGNIYNRRLYFTSIIEQGKNFCVDSGMNLEEDRWYHYVAVVSDSGSTIYINGVEITIRRYNLGSTKTSSVFFDDVPSRELLSIGYGRYSQEEPFFSFNGLIDDLLIYDRALSRDEVMELFAAAGLKMGSPELGYIDASSMVGKSPIERGGRGSGGGAGGAGNRQQGNFRNLR